MFGILPALGTALRTAHDPARSALIKLAVFLIPTGRIQEQMTTVVKLFDALKDTDESLFPLLTALANPLAEYTGFPQFGLPIVLKRGTDLAQSDSTGPDHEQILMLLANLMNTGQLESVLHPTTPSPGTARFVRGVAKFVLSVLEHAQDQDDWSDGRSLLAAAHLAAALVNTNTALVTVLDQLVARAVAAGDKQRTTELLRTLSAAVTNLEYKRVQGVQLDALSDASFLPQCYDMALQAGPHDAHLFLALRELLLAFQSQGLAPRIPQELKTKLTYPPLRNLAMASDVRTRCAAWDVLLFGPVGSLASLVEELRDMEQLPLQPEMVRNRQVKIQSLTRLAHQAIKRDSPSTLDASKIIVDALVSTLKVNLRPLWKEANTALADVAHAVPDLVFNVAFDELSADHSTASLDPTPASAPGVGATSTSLTPSLDAVIPQELFPAEPGMPQPPKEWIDPQLAIREADVNTALSASGPSAPHWDDGTPESISRLDVPNYRLQILNLLSLIPQAVQQNNKPMVELFFQVKDNLVESVYATEKPEVKTIVWDGMGQKLRTTTYTALLKVFSRMPHLRKVHQSADLRAAFLESCAAKDGTVQMGALAALLAYREAELTHYTKSLENLLGKSTQRDELATFDLAPDAGQIDLAHRPMLLPVVQHIFFGQMTATTGRRNLSGYKSRRIAMLNNLARCVPEELGPFFDLMTLPFKDDLAKLDFSGPEGTFIPSSAPLTATERQQRGFLVGLADVLRYLRLSLAPYWRELVGLVLTITVHAARSVTTSKEEETDTVAARTLRQLGLRRLNDMFNLPVGTQGYDWAPFKSVIIKDLVSPRLPSLAAEGIDSVGALHTLFVTWSKDPSLARWLQEDPSTLPQLFSLLAARALKEPVASAVLSVMENLTEAALPDEDEDESDRDVVLSEMIGNVATDFTRDVAIWCSNRGKHAAEGKHQILLRSTQQLIKLATNFDISDSDAALLFDSLVSLVAAGSLGRNERLKTQVFSILSGLLAKLPEGKATLDQGTVLQQGSFIHLLATTFNEGRLPELRMAASKTLSAWAEVDNELAPVAGLVADLNAYDRKHLDDIDIDRRLGAFDKLDEIDWADLQTFE